MKKLTALLFLMVLALVMPAQIFAASLSLSPTSGTFNKGCSFSLEVNLNTAGAQTDGVDAILFYDPSRFSATSIQNGTMYPDNPGNSIDEKNNKIVIIGIASISSAISGTGTLATVNFTVKDTAPAGATQVRFDFDPQDKTKTTDSNVAERNTSADLLSSVTNGNYVVGSSGSCGQVSPTPGGVGGPAATPSGAVKPTVPDTKPTLPDAGTPEITMAVAIVGGILTILGILGLVFL